mmetsp:Transcript_9634/g.32247  ORF Transcript_9634/g.32247 Transcript_9634/m.32247 type:complete len:238 (+) Transcript_9634:1912-2625(+)
MITIVPVTDEVMSEAGKLIRMEERISIARCDHDVVGVDTHPVHHQLLDASCRPVLVGRLAGDFSFLDFMDGIAKTSQLMGVLLLEDFSRLLCLGVSGLHGHADHNLLGDGLIGNSVQRLPELHERFLVVGNNDCMPDRIEVQGTKRSLLLLPVVGSTRVVLLQQVQAMKSTGPHDPESDDSIEHEEANDADCDVRPLHQQPNMPKIDEESKSRVCVDGWQSCKDGVGSPLHTSTTGF